MKIQLSKIPGGPETLELVEMKDPVPAPNEALIRIHAAGANYPDALLIRDLYQMKPPRPFAPGAELSGEVLAVGEAVSRVAPGDRVLAFSTMGGFATHICLDENALIRIPDTMPYDHAACFMLTYATSWHALTDRGRLKPGETVLILGAAGGVGVAALELAKSVGARVIAAVSSDEKARFCNDLGADMTLIYKREFGREDQKAFTAEIKHLAGPEGVNVVYDAVGGNYSEPAFRSLAWGGRFLVVGFPAGTPKLPLNLPLLKGSDVVGVFWGTSTIKDPEGHRKNMKHLFDLYEAGKICPRISATFPLAQASKALNLLEQRKALGKVVVTTA